ncbi:MAG: hypothetical protein ACI9XO_003316 [Paraglaciecola sp.]|jgi:hypothetical protein
MKEKSNVSQDLQNELDAIHQEAFMSEAQRKKKLMMWGIRNLLSAALIWYFWEATWMKYALWVIIPLSLLSLGMILFYNKIVSSRLERAQGKVDSLEETIQSAREED